MRWNVGLILLLRRRNGKSVCWISKHTGLSSNRIYAILRKYEPTKRIQSTGSKSDLGIRLQSSRPDLRASSDDRRLRRSG